nr:FAD/NAD(P)-binding oxidoreductase family protein [Tanacetum cinerariifolium]
MVNNSWFFEWIIALGFMLLAAVVSSKNHDKDGCHDKDKNGCDDKYKNGCEFDVPTDLLEALLKELPPGTIRYSSKVATIDELDWFKLVYLADGSILKTKVLVGCDGVNSVVAKWLGLDPPVSVGRAAIRGLVEFPNGSGFDPMFHVNFGGGIRFGFLPVDVLVGCDGFNSVVAKWLGLDLPVSVGRAAIRGLVEFPNGSGFDPMFHVNFGGWIRFGFLPVDVKTVYWFCTLTPSEVPTYEEDWQENPSKMKQFVLSHINKMPQEAQDVVEKTFKIASPDTGLFVSEQALDKDRKLAAIRGLVEFPNGSGFDPMFHVNFGGGIRFGFLPVDVKTVYWFCTLTPSEVPTYEEDWQENPSKMKQFVLSHINKMPQEAQDVVEKTSLSNISYATLKFRLPWNVLLGNIVKDNVCVAGDALHPMTPDIGQGGCSSLEDSVLLFPKAKKGKMDQ